MGSITSPNRPFDRTGHRAGFTLVEMMVVIGVIIILLGLLLPALSVARKNAAWAGSQNNLRQTYTLITAYTTDNRDYIPPSRFDYSTAPYPGKVRTWLNGARIPGGGQPLGQQSQGSWADIIWTSGSLGPISLVAGEPGQATEIFHDYRYDSPDRQIYDILPGFESILRSQVPNSFNAKNPILTEATPIGDGAEELGEPGYFAANDFFDSTGVNGKWWTTGQMRRPTLSVYLVDSAYGEAIPATDEAWDGRLQSVPDARGHVDFRYLGDQALLLCLDGRILSQERWESLTELNEKTQLRIGGLDQ